MPSFYDHIPVASHARARRWLIYMLVCGVLVAINLYQRGGISWSIYPLIGWGAALLLRGTTPRHDPAARQSRPSIARPHRFPSSQSEPQRARLCRYRRVTGCNGNQTTVACAAATSRAVQCNAVCTRSPATTLLWLMLMLMRRIAVLWLFIRGHILALPRHRPSERIAWAA